jgi:hypothetical protein
VSRAPNEFTESLLLTSTPDIRLVGGDPQHPARAQLPRPRHHRSSCSPTGRVDAHCQP